MLVMLGEFTRRCLAIVVARRLRSNDALHCLADLFVTHGPTEHIRSDNGPEFVAINVWGWLCNPAPSSNDKEDAKVCVGGLLHRGIVRAARTSAVGLACGYLNGSYHAHFRCMKAGRTVD